MSDATTETVELPTGNRRTTVGGISRGLRESKVAALTAFFTFWMRYFLADKNSYWLDELYSVERYIAQYDSVLDALRSLADTSIHPPLYQGILFFWVELFGDRETATRTLSNILVTVSILFVHRFAIRYFNPRVANAVAIAYAMSYGTIYYGLETRSYALSLALSTMSSYAAIVFLDQRSSSPRYTWRSPAGLASAALLSGSNIGLMLTHYFNFYFIIAQVIFVPLYIAATRQSGRAWRRLGGSAALYLFQLMVFLAVWGRITIRSYQRNTGRFEADEITYTPRFIVESVTNQNVSLWRLPTLLVLALALGFVCWRGWSKHRGNDPRLDGQSKPLGSFYLLVVIIGAPTLAFASFSLASAERYSWRYFIFLVPPLLTILAAAIDDGLHALLQTARGRMGVLQPRSLDRAIAVLAVAALLILVLPDSMRAARNTKDDWRGMAQDIAAIVDSNPESEYAILEPAFRTTPVYNYYLGRYGQDLEVLVTFRRLEERRGHNFGFDKEREALETHDYAIIPFVHHRTTNFPNAIRVLEERYEVAHRQIDDQNKGIVIFRLTDDS